MSKAKVFGFVVVLVVAILITFFITKNALTYSCGEKDKKSIPEEDAPQQAQSHRLPTNVLPINYGLKLQPFIGPNEFHFNGTVSILVNAVEATDVIQLNAYQLEIPDQQVVISGRNVTVKVSSMELKDQFLTFKLATSLTRNQNYTLFIPFRGNLTKSLEGFYLSSYVDLKDNEAKYIAMTHFEANQARRAFPCFDEPAMKATFDVEIVHYSNMTAIGNMPEKSKETIDADWSRTTFNRTVKMSTYLVAYAIGNLEFSETLQPNKTEFRVATKPGESANTAAALEFGPAILAHYEEYFNIPFPLPKIDNLATPDFDAGAMENFGLITYRESMFLYDQNYGSAEYKFVVCQTIAHELAHQWSGNLVTPKFWDDLWLNEGFADYISYEGVHKVRPNWQVWDRFVVDEVQHVMTMDSLKNTHPISVKVNSPEEAEELFDLISYEKGASVIRMLANIIGKKAFREGMHNYLEAFKFSNADQNDLWQYLQAANDQHNGTKKNLTKVMESWTLQEGYPLVTVTRDYATNKTVHFSQKRFLLNSDDEQALISTHYEVPISYLTKSDAEASWEPITKLWLNQTSDKESRADEELSVPGEDWIIVNLQETGYYRVTYDNHNWQLLIDQLLTDHTKIHVINRAQILDDLFRLAENGVVHYGLALRALGYLKKETEVLPWLSFDEFIKPINRILTRTEIYGDWKNFIRDLVQTTYERIGAIDYGDEDLPNGKLQRVVVGVACDYDLDSCVTKSTGLFSELISKKATNNPIQPNLRSPVYRTGIAHNDKEAWDFLFESYLKEPNANERKDIIMALACTRVPWMLDHYLNLAFNESSGIRTQDVVYVFRSLKASNFEYGRDVAFRYLLDNWQLIHEIQGEFKTFGEVIDTFDSFSSSSELASLESLYRSLGHKVGRSKRSFLQTLDKIQANMRWMERNLHEIASFFKERK